MVVSASSVATDTRMWQMWGNYLTYPGRLSLVYCFEGTTKGG